MNLFDIIILAVLFFFALKGALRGLVNEVSSLAGLVLGGWLAYRYYPSLAAPISATLHIPAYLSAFLAFILLLFTIGFIAHILGNIVTSALRLVMLGGFNRLGGLVIGAIEGALLLSMLFSVGTASYMPEGLKTKIYASNSAGALAHAGDAMLSAWRGKTGRQP